MSSPVLFNDKVLQHTRVLATHGCPPRPSVWLHPMIRQVLWRYASILYKVHCQELFNFRRHVALREDPGDEVDIEVNKKLKKLIIQWPER